MTNEFAVSAVSFILLFRILAKFDASSKFVDLTIVYLVIHFVPQVSGYYDRTFFWGGLEYLTDNIENKAP